MTIFLSDAGKRFNREWIFRHFTFTFQSGNSYAITGPNGSGKSTLLQVISGSMHFNEGKLRFVADEKEIPSEQFYRHISYCAPYLEVVEEMTLVEFFDFHKSFKPFLPGMDTTSVIKEIGLEKAADKQIRYYSSGMKQRVKLAQCIFSATPILLLDEPCTNLDVAGINLYERLISEYGKDRLIIVCSNDKTEYQFCETILNISDFK